MPMTNPEIEAAFQETMRSNETRAAETADLDRRVADLSRTVRALEGQIAALRAELSAPRERQPIEVALLRALWTAIPLALGAYLTTYQAGGDVQTAIVAAVTAAAGVFLARGGVEGAVDQSRAQGK